MKEELDFVISKRVGEPALVCRHKVFDSAPVQADVATSIGPAHYVIAQCVVMVFAWQAHCDCL